MSPSGGALRHWVVPVGRRPLSDREAVWFAQRLERALTDLGVSRKDLGERLGGKSGPYISQLLSGNTHPSRRRVQEIEHALGVGTGTLLRPPGEEAPVDDRALAEAPLATLTASLAGAEGLVRAGRLDTATTVLDALVQRLQVLAPRSGAASARLIEALLLRSRARGYLCQRGEALADVSAARDLAERMPADASELLLRAYFWHLYVTDDERGREALAGVLDRPMPRAEGSAFAYLPLAIEALLAPDDEAEHAAAARLAPAVAGAPYSAEKAATLFVLQCRASDEVDWQGMWASEARAAGDIPSLVTALHHSSQRCFMDGDWRRGYALLVEATGLAVDAQFDRAVNWLADFASQVLQPPMVERVTADGLDEAWLLAEVVRPLRRVLAEVHAGARWLTSPRGAAASALLQCAALHGDVRGAERLARELASPDERWLCPSLVAASLCWVVVALGGTERADGLWATTARLVDLAPADGKVAAGLRDVGFVAGCVLGRHDVAVRALAFLVDANPTDAWAWALLARSRLALGDLVGAVEAAERAWDLMSHLPEELAVRPIEFPRLPREKALRREFAREEARGWLVEVFGAVKAARALPAPTRARARAAIAALSSRGA